MLRSCEGFTLIELMVVIVIIGILATLAIPKFNEASVKSKVAEAPTILASYDNGQLAYVAETGTLGTITHLAFMGPGGTKYYTYAESYGAAWTTADYHATAASSGMGAVNNKVITTRIDNAQEVTHTGAAEFAQYVPNWK